MVLHTSTEQLVLLAQTTVLIVWMVMDGAIPARILTLWMKMAIVIAQVIPTMKCLDNVSKSHLVMMVNTSPVSDAQTVVTDALLVNQ
jgi:hypothetical protein